MSTKQEIESCDLVIGIRHDPTSGNDRLVVIKNRHGHTRLSPLGPTDPDAVARHMRRLVGQKEPPQ